MLYKISNTFLESINLEKIGNKKLNTNSNIKVTGKRNKVIEWENPNEQLHRKGLRLIEDKYTPISLD